MRCRLMDPSHVALTFDQRNVADAHGCRCHLQVNAGITSCQVAPLAHGHIGLMSSIGLAPALAVADTLACQIILLLFTQF